MLDRPPIPEAAVAAGAQCRARLPRERQRGRQRRYRARQREGRSVPDIGADEISFLSRRNRSRRVMPPIGALSDAHHHACGYSKLTRKLRTRRLSSQLNLRSSGPRRLEASVDA
jgi:hypothetical protein